MLQASLDTAGRVVNESKLAGRLDSYDVVKGVLVETMIVYHCVNYFLSFEHKLLNYLDFVTGAFVLLAGRMVTHYYVKEYEMRPGLMVQRLLTRSVKLIVLFAVLNTCVHLALKRNYNGANFSVSYFYSNLYEVFVLGSKYIASFEILLPIAYTLALGGILAFLVRSKAILGTVICVLLAVLSVAEELPFNLKFIGFGLGGMLYGCFREESFSATTRRWVAWSAIILAITYMAVVTVIDHDNWAIYFLGVWSVVQCIRMIAEKSVAENWLVRLLKLYGKYSLFSYLIQILFLQLLFRALGGNVSGGLMVGVSIILTNILLYLSIKRLSVMEEKHQFVRLAYRKVFA